MDLRRDGLAIRACAFGRRGSREDGDSAGAERVSWRAGNSWFGPTSSHIKEPIEIGNSSKVFWFMMAPPSRGGSRAAALPGWQRRPVGPPSTGYRLRDHRAAEINAGPTGSNSRWSAFRAGQKRCLQRGRLSLVISTEAVVETGRKKSIRSAVDQGRQY